MKVLAVLIVIAGLVIAVAPQYTNCEAQGGTMPSDTKTGTTLTLPPATTIASMQTSVAASVLILVVNELTRDETGGAKTAA